MTVFLRSRGPAIGPVLAVPLLLVLLWPAPAEAGQQPPKSLGEIAREEAARRKAMAEKTKVYTKADLPKHVPPPAPAGGGSAAAAGTPEAAGEKPSGGDEKDEAWWRDRITKAREGLRRSEMFAQALQTRINSLNADFNSRDDPIQRAAVGEERARALAEIEAVRAEIKTLQQQIAGIEDEARRTNVPPGWVR